MSRSTIRKKQKTSDGYSNTAARLGLDQNNFLAQSRYGKSHITRSPQELDAMYRSSWIVGRMVEVVAENMTRAGITLQATLQPGEIDQLYNGLKSSGVPGRLSDAIKWARLYGGALAVVLIDGHKLSEPLNMETIPKDGFRGLYILDRHQVTPSQEKIQELGAMLGYPASYKVNSDALQGETIHHSRAIRFIGIELPMRERIAEQGWGASVVERALDRIYALDSSTYGAANLMFRSFLRVINVTDFRQLLASPDGSTKLANMFAMIRQMQSNEGITVLDAKDTFSTHNWTFTGIYEALQAFAEQISGATGIPLVRLLGQSPKGFSTGESDLKMYYETILTSQEDDLQGPVKFILDILSWSKWQRTLPEGATFSFNPLSAPSDLEKSQIATADGQLVAGVHTAGIISRSRALATLRESARVTGRFAGITDEEIADADAEDQPPLPPSMPEETDVTGI